MDGRIKEFLDRQDVFERIKPAVEAYNGGQVSLRVFAFYGVGGIGKTRLVEGIRAKYGFKNKLVITSFSSEAEFLKRLLDIRTHFLFAPNFDYLFLRYWEIEKAEKLDDRYVEILKTQFEKVTGKLIKTAEIFAPPAAGELLKIFRNFFSKHRSKKTEKEFEFLLENIKTRSEELLCKLPKILAEDINLEKNNTQQLKPIFIFDDYNAQLIGGYANWTQKFIDSFSAGIFILTSREKPCLDHFICKSKEVLELSALPEEDARDYMKKQGIKDDMIKVILEKTSCIPIYLELALEVLLNEGPETTSESFNNLVKSREQLVALFLDHLSEDERRIIYVLATIGVFNKSIFEAMFNSNKPLHKDHHSYEEFAKKTIMTDEFNSGFRIQQVIAQNIVKSLKNEEKQRYATCYLEVLKAREIATSSPHETVPFIVSAFKLMAEYFPESIEAKNLDNLFELVLFLMDTAWITEFYDGVKNLDFTGVLRSLLDFVRACQMRQEKINSGLEILKNIPLESFGNSKHKKTVICEMNYIESIEGNYITKEKDFEEFYYEHCDNDNDNDKYERFYLKGSIYHADMLMMRGNFKKALEILERLERSDFGDANPSLEPILYEIWRHRGHCYRFNMQLDLALRYYKREVCNDNHIPIKIKAYQLTTQIETLCYFHPNEAQKLAAEALDINRKLNSSNNLAKIYNALAIAALHSKSYKEAENYISVAFEINKESKYIAGNIFTWLAKAYLEFSQNGLVSEETIWNFCSLNAQVDGVYGYLFLPIHIMNNDTQAIELIKESFEWLNFQETVSGYSSFFAIIKQSE